MKGRRIGCARHRISHASRTGRESAHGSEEEESMIKVTEFRFWRQYETDTDYEVVVTINGKREEWHAPVVLYPAQPPDVYAVPIVGEWDGTGRMPEPDAVDGLVRAMDEMSREIIEEKYGRGE